MNRIKKGDTVKVLSGKDSGKTGKVLDIPKDGEKVVVEGINIFTRHERPKRQGAKVRRFSILPRCTCPP